MSHPRSPGAPGRHPAALLREHPPRSLADVARAAARYGDAPQLAYEDEVWTFTRHHAAVARLAGALMHRFGVEKGDRIAIAMRNYPEFSLAFWASQLVGAIVVPLNAWWQAAETERVLDLTAPKIVIADGERLPRVTPWAVAGRVPLLTVRSDDSGLSSLLSVIADHDEEAPLVPIDPVDPSTMLFTSGTTGDPKGVIHTHGNHLANLLRTLEVSDIETDRPRAQLATMPLFHISQLSSLYINAASGALTVLMRKWDAAVAAELIDRHGVTQMGGVPMQVAQILDIVDAGRTLPSLEAIGIGATSVPPHLPTRVWDLFGGRVSPLTGYGMTETTSSVTSLSGEEFVRRPNSVGRPHPFNDIELRDAGTVVAMGEVGEVWVRGPNVTTMEWSESGPVTVRSAEEFVDSGDLARFDEEGFLTIVGRSKDIIIRAGENVHSVEVESALLQHPAIEAAAVIGLPHGTWGEEVTAVIRPRPGVQIDFAELGARLAGELAYFKLPTRFHLISEEFPSTATGKTIKAELRAAYRDAAPDFSLDGTGDDAHRISSRG